jgi:hypothetical protein
MMNNMLRQPERASSEVGMELKQVRHEVDSTPQDCGRRGRVKRCCEETRCEEMRCEEMHY